MEKADKMAVKMNGMRLITEVPTEAEPGRFPEMRTRAQREATKQGTMAAAAGQSRSLSGAIFISPGFW